LLRKRWWWSWWRRLARQNKYNTLYILNMFTYLQHNSFAPLPNTNRASFNYIKHRSEQRQYWTIKRNNVWHLDEKTWALRWFSFVFPLSCLHVIFARKPWNVLINRCMMPHLCDIALSLRPMPTFL
jgi:hypothetical protein